MPADKKPDLSHDLAKALVSIQNDKRTPVSKSRVEVLIAIAKIDNRLQEVLKDFLLPCTSDNDDLLDEGGILGSFMLRAKLAYRLGIIGTMTYWTLKELSKIRNICAHKDEDIDIFKLAEVVSRVNGIWSRMGDVFRKDEEGKIRKLSVEQKFNELCDLILMVIGHESKIPVLNPKAGDYLFTSKE